MKTHKFARKTFYVDAVRVSEANIEEVAEWSGGTIETDSSGHTFLKVEVARPLNDRQTQAYIGDWVLSAGTGFKVYTPKAFEKAFEKVKYLTKEQADAAGITVPHEPRPASEQKAKQSETPKPGPPKNRPNRRPKKGAAKKPARVGHVGQALKEAQDKAEAKKKPDVDYRSSETGKFVTEEEAKANPATTTGEIFSHAKKPEAVEEQKVPEGTPVVETQVDTEGLTKSPEDIEAEKLIKELEEEQ